MLHGGAGGNAEAGAFTAGGGGGGGYYGGGGGGGGFDAPTGSCSGGSGGGGSSWAHAQASGVTTEAGVWPLMDGKAVLSWLDDGGPTPVAVNVTPAQAKSPGETVTVTAQVLDQDGNAMAGRVVTFDRRGVNPGTSTAITDGLGNARLAYAGTGGGGADVVTASTPSLAGTTVSGIGTVVWTQAPAVSGTAVAFTPPGAHAPSGTATLPFRAVNADGSPFVGTVRYAIGPLGAPGPFTGSTSTDSAGQGSVPVTTGSSEVEVVAYADRGSPGTFGNRDDAEALGLAVVTTRPAPTGTVVAFSPPVVTGPVGSPIQLPFKAARSNGSAFAGTVRWCATPGGSTTTSCTSSGTAAADASGDGVVTVTPTTSNPTLRVTAYADSLTPGTQDPSELAGAAVASGTSPPPVTTTTTVPPVTTTSTSLPPVTTTTLPPVTTTTLPPVTTTTTTLPPVTTTTTIPPVPTNNPPGAPTLVDPPNGKTFADGEPQVFTVSATDPNGDPYTGTITVTNTSTGATRTFPTSAAPSGATSSGIPAPLLAAGSYTWNARATDAKGANSPTSSSRSFTVASSSAPLPGAPNVIAPAHGKTFGPGEPQAFVINASSPTFTAYSGVVTIRHATGGAVAATVTTSTTLWGLPSSGTTMPPLPPGSYTFTARTTPTGGVDSPPSLPRSFTVTSDIANAAPSAPSLVAPASAAAMSPTDPQRFVVNAVDPDGDAYTATVAVTNTNATTTTFLTTPAASGGDSEGVPPIPLPEGLYTWRAQSTDARGLNSSWSELQSFAVANNPPLAPTLLSPAPAASFSPDDVQAFTAVSNDAQGDPYTTTITIRSPGGATVASYTGAVAPSGQPSRGVAAPPLAIGNYTWSARATDVRGVSGPESARRAISVIANSAPTIPTQIAPTVGKTFYLGDPQLFTIAADDVNGDTYTGTVTIKNLLGAPVDTFKTSPAGSGGHSNGVPTMPLSPGDYLWSAVATDASGATGSSTPDRRITVSAFFDMPPAAIPSDRATTSASKGALADLPDDESLNPAISADGRYIAFESLASNLVLGDTNNRRDIFVYDRVTSLTERVSVGDDEAQASAGGAWFESFGGSISAGGRYVAFISSATNLVAGDTNGRQDVFVRDREEGTTIRASLSAAGAQANGSTYEAMISGSGLHVAFASDASNLVAGDTNDLTDVFVRDLATQSSPGTTVRVSVSFLNGYQATGGILGSRNPSISADGRMIGFESDATNLLGYPDSNFADDVFMHDRQSNLKTFLVSNDVAQDSANGYSNNARVSGWGDAVLFDSTASNLSGVTGDTNAVRDVFVWNSNNATSRRVSLNSSQAQGTRPSYGGALSPDGRYAAFVSESVNLVHGDRNGVEDVFLRDLRASTSTLLSHDADGHQANNTSSRPSVAQDAMHIAFESRSSNLVHADTNRARDVFGYNRRLSLTCVGDPVSTVGCLSGYGFKAASDRIGLEHFYGYRAFDIGSDTAFLNVSNGNLVVQGTDLEIPGRGLNMELTHTYNSLKDRGEGPLGRGWRIGIADGKSDDLLGSVVSAALSADVGQLLEVIATQDQFDFFDADGTRHHFIKGGPDGPGWHAPPGIDLKLTDYLVGAELRYRAIRPDGVAYEFRPSGAGGGYLVDRIVDRNGNQLAFSYSGGRISAMTDAEGRSVSFVWSGDYLASATYGGTTVNYNVDPATGRLTSISVGGRTTAYSYAPPSPNDPGGLTSATDARGNTTTFTLDDGMLETLTDRAGKAWIIAYNETSPECQAGDTQAVVLTCITDPESNTESYTSSAAGNPLTYRDAGDPATNQTSRVWDANRVVSETNAAGTTTEYAYNATGQVVLARESGGGDEPLTTVLTYRDMGPGVADLVETHVGVGSGDLRVWRFGRSETGNMTDVTDPEGATTRFTHDTAGRITSTTDAAGKTTTYTNFHSSGQPHAVTDPLGKTRTFGFDAFGRVTSMVDRNGVAWGITHDARGNIATLTSPHGTATYQYDANDNQTVATPPGGTTSNMDYDKRDLLEETRTVVDGVLRKSRYDYAPDGQLAVVHEPREYAGSPTALQRVEYRRYPNNRVESMIDENGFVTDVTYTRDGNIHTVREPQGSAGPKVTTYTYNRRGQVTTMTDSGHANPITNAFNIHGERTSTKTRMGETTTMIYDKVGRLLRSIDPLGRQSVRTYDAVGNLLTLTQPEGQGGQLTTSYSYDARHQLRTESDPADGGHIVEYAYDNEGRQRFRYDRHNGTTVRTVETSYRADGAMTGITATGPGLPTHASTYGYDAAGNLTSASASLNGAPVSALSIVHNGAFEATSWTETVYNTAGVPITKSGSYSYQPDKLLAARTVDGLTTGYQYTTNGRELRVTPWGGMGSFDNAYYDNGLLRSIAVPNGVAINQVFDGADRLVSRLASRNGGLTTLAGWTAITHDENDQKTRETITQAQPTGVDRAGNAEYTYDALGRLTYAADAFEPHKSTHYALDDGGNVLSDWDSTFRYAKNRLVHAAGTTVETFPDGGSTTVTTNAEFHYDALGNQSRQNTVETRTSRLEEAGATHTVTPVRTYTYDAASHPLRVAEDDGSFVDFTYDALGRLARRVEHTPNVVDKTTLFFHDGMSDQLTVETDNAGAVTTRYVLDSTGEPVAQDKEGSRSYYIDDPRGDLTQQLDQASAVVSVYAYDPYGTEKEKLTTSIASKWESRLRFQMAPSDPKFGVYNLGGRLLNPGINRFVGADSYIGAAANLGLAADPLTGNRYIYAGGNPAGMIDDGHGWLKKITKSRLFKSVVAMAAIAIVCGASVGIACGVAVGVAAYSALHVVDYHVNTKNKTLKGYAKAAKGGIGDGALEGALFGLGKKLKAARDAARRAKELAEEAARAAKVATVTSRAGGIGYRNMEAFVKVHGKAGPGMEWHHIVEQHAANIEKFGPEAIHNTANLMRMEVSIHRKISGYYSRKPEQFGGLRVRDWVKTQSFDDQFDFGVTIVRRFGGGG